MRNWVLVLIGCTVLGATSSCRQIDLFEKNTTIKNNSWASDYPATGTFHITDTTAYYELFLVLRHADAYAFNNIWLNVGLQPPGDTMSFQRVNVKLGTDATGWFGTGMNDIWEMRHKLTGMPQRFVKPGVYRFSIAQIMREDPLPGIMSAGFRVQKAEMPR